MQRQISLDILLRYLGLKADKSLEQALTHTSFSDERNSSRFVFTGMFVFKGLVAEWCSTHIQGSGTQLQHYLGNITGKASMDDFFNYVNLKRQIRYGDSCNVDQQKHIFAYGLLGWISAVASPATCERFIYRFFIAPNDHLLPHTHYTNDPWQQLQFLCKQEALPLAKRILTKDYDTGLFTCTVSCNGLQFSHQSVSYRYVQKKAIRLALKHLASTLANHWQQHPNHILVQQQLAQQQKEAMERDRAARHEAFHQKQQKKMLQKIINKQDELKRRKLEEEKRRSLKKMIKENKVQKKQSVFREYNSEEIANMSSAKRRRLEDRGII